MSLNPYRTILLAAIAMTATQPSAGERGGADGGGLTPGCPADVAPPNGDGVVNVNDLLAVINGWGACPNPCPPHCGPDIDQSCAVNVNDLLAVINAWGPCACARDGYEPNDDCSTYRTLPTVGSNQTLQVNNAKLHGPNDQDYFRINATETDSSCSCCDPFCTDEDYQLTVRLTVPASSTVAYRMCSGLACANLNNCTTVQPGQQGQVVWTFDGACPGVDTYSVYARIAPLSPADPGCANYTLTYQFVPGCF